MKKNFNENILFNECIDALKANVNILSEHEAENIWNSFKSKIPIINGGSRIDWKKIKNHCAIESLEEVLIQVQQLLQSPVKTNVYVLWNDASVPIIKTDLNLVLKYFDDVTCVGFETWLYNPEQGYVIEYYYLGQMNAGLV